MTHVNSSLVPHEKVMRKEYLRDLAELNGWIMSFPEYRVTVAFMPEFPGSKMMLVSISFAEYRETKFKRKVGEYHALDRMFNLCEYIKVPSVFDVDSMFGYAPEEIAEYQAEWAKCFAASLVL